MPLTDYVYAAPKGSAGVERAWMMPISNFFVLGDNLSTPESLRASACFLVPPECMILTRSWVKVWSKLCEMQDTLAPVWPICLSIPSRIQRFHKYLFVHTVTFRIRFARLFFVRYLTESPQSYRYGAVTSFHVSSSTLSGLIEGASHLQLLLRSQHQFDGVDQS